MSELTRQDKIDQIVETISTIVELADCEKVRFSTKISLKLILGELWDKAYIEGYNDSQRDGDMSGYDLRYDDCVRTQQNRSSEAKVGVPEWTSNVRSVKAC